MPKALTAAGTLGSACLLSAPCSLHAVCPRPEEGPGGHTADCSHARPHSGAPPGRPPTPGARVGPGVPIPAQASMVPAGTGPDCHLPPRWHSPHVASSPERPASLARSGLPRGHSCTQGSPALVIYSRARRPAEHQVPADVTLWGSEQARWHPAGAALGAEKAPWSRRQLHGEPAPGTGRGRPRVNQAGD